MLYPYDAKIVAADPELPALSVILDDAAALALFVQHVPGLQPTAARCTYLRYKPHTSCLAAFTLDTSEGQQSFYITAYRADAADKLAKSSRCSQLPDGRCPAPLIIPELAIVVSPFPCDSELPALERVVRRDGRGQLLSRLIPDDEQKLSSAEWITLRYKPERRFVARLDIANQPWAVLKLHSEKIYAQARRAAKSLGSTLGINTARTLGHSDRHRAILTKWLAGKTLLNLFDESPQAEVAMEAVGRLLAQLHTQPIYKLPQRSSELEAEELCRLAEDLAALSPSLAESMRMAAQRCSEKMVRFPTIEVPLHGDFHPQQILVDGGEAALIDLDNAALGHPASDVGNLLAHLEREVLRGRLNKNLREQLTEAMLSTYARQYRSPDRHAVQVYLAAGLLRLAHEPFRYRQPNWHNETETIVERAIEILDDTDKRSIALSNSDRKGPTGPSRDTDVNVTDPFDLKDDVTLPNATKAINPKFANHSIAPIIRQTFQDDSLEIYHIRVLRHKPGRRCLVEYSCKGADAEHDVVVLGKVHAKRRQDRSNRLQQSLWESGFDYDSDDGISVARPVGVVPDCQMWLQESVPGKTCWDALSGPHRDAVAARVADAAHKLHQTNIVTERVHTIDDELQILEEKLPHVVRLMPRFRSRIDAVLAVCRELAASIPSATLVGIHRDFYPDQIMVDGDRIYVLDHDLYCMGDPCLDIGNFCGHLIERSLRRHGHPDAYAESQRDLVERFCSVREERNSAGIDAYTTLTVVRHIYLGTRIAGRRSSTSAILSYCEQALSFLMA